MPQQKKIFASLFSRTRGSVDGTLKCVIEYVFVYGPARSGKVSVDIGPIGNESSIQDDLKDALVVFLNNMFPGEFYTSNDVVGLRV